MTKYILMTQVNFTEEDYKNWEPLSLQETLKLLKGLTISWAFAGGYAIELFVGESFRDHGDMDILIQRKDQLKIQQHLADWELYRAALPGLKYWEKDEFLQGKIKDIWARPDADSPWKLQIMLFDVEERQWIYKRDPEIREDLEKMTYPTTSGIRYLAPEIQLLYKAKNIRPKDQQDFEKAMPMLDKAAKLWLFKALRKGYPQGHVWIDSLQS